MKQQVTEQGPWKPGRRDFKEEAKDNYGVRSCGDITAASLTWLKADVLKGWV